MLTIAVNPSPKTLRGFARVWFPLFVLVAGGVLRWRFGYPTAAATVWTVGAALGGAVLASPRAARVVFTALTTATRPIGFVVSTVALAVLFYLMIAPLGLAMRFAGRDPLRLRARHQPSHWLPHEQDDDPARAFRQF